MPTPCTKSAVYNTQQSAAALRNETGDFLTPITPDGQRKKIGVGGWDRFELAPGETLKLLDAMCTSGACESALAVIR